MTAISNNEIARAIYSVTKDKPPAEHPETFKKIVQFLARRHLLGRSPDILSALEKIINQAEGRLSVKVRSAEKLGEKTKTHLVQTLKKRYSAKGIVLKEMIDKKLLGGLRLEIDDEVIDLSVRNRIVKLQEYLTGK